MLWTNAIFVRFIGAAEPPADMRGARYCIYTPLLIVRRHRETITELPGQSA